MGLRSRRKGHSYEREIAKRFKEIFPKARRHLEYHPDDAKGYDLDGTGPFRIQCKCYAKYAPISKIREIKETDGINMLITKGDRERDVVCLYLDDFIEILKDIGYAYEDRGFK